MTAPVNGPSVRDENPWTVSAGVGAPEFLRVDVARNITDDVAVGAEAGVGPLGVSGGVQGTWYALKSDAHGHAMFLKGGAMVAPRGAEGGGNDTPFLGIEAGLGWEWRSRSGPTIQVEGGAAYLTQFGPGAERGFAPTFGIRAGWSF